MAQCLLVGCLSEQTLILAPSLRMAQANNKRIRSRQAQPKHYAYTVK